MSSPWTNHPAHIPTDNFKVQRDLFIQSPIGLFVEEVMYWIQQERRRFGMEDYPFFIYDELIFPSGSNPQSSVKGPGWIAEGSGATPIDTQKIAFDPIDDPFVLGKGFIENTGDAFICNYIKDIAESMLGTELFPFNTDPLSSGTGLGQVMGAIYTSGDGNTAQPRLNLSQLKTEKFPEFDTDLNTLRPKLGLAYLDDERIKIANILGPMVSDGLGNDSGGTTISDENILNDFKLKDENGEPLGTPTQVYIAGSLFGFGTIYGLFGSTLRVFDNFGRAGLIDIGPDIYSIALGSVDDFLVLGGTVFFISGGNLSKRFLAQPSSNIPITIDYISGDTGLNPLGNGDFVQRNSCTTFTPCTRLSLCNEYTALADGDPLATTELTGIAKLVAANSIPNKLGYSFGLLIGSEIFLYNATSNLVAGQVFLGQAFDEVIPLGAPSTLTHFDTPSGTGFGNTAFSTFLGISSNTGNHFGYHNLPENFGFNASIKERISSVVLHCTSFDPDGCDPILNSPECNFPNGANPNFTLSGTTGVSDYWAGGTKVEEAVIRSYKLQAFELEQMSNKQIFVNFEVKPTVYGALNRVFSQYGFCDPSFFDCDCNGVATCFGNPAGTASCPACDQTFSSNVEYSIEFNIYTGSFPPVSGDVNALGRSILSIPSLGAAIYENIGYLDISGELFANDFVDDGAGGKIVHIISTATHVSMINNSDPGVAGYSIHPVNSIARPHEVYMTGEF